MWEDEDVVAHNQKVAKDKMRIQVKSHLSYQKMAQPQSRQMEQLIAVAAVAVQQLREERIDYTVAPPAVATNQWSGPYTLSRKARLRTSSA